MRTVPSSARVRLAALGLFFAFGMSFGVPALAQDLREDGSAIIYTEIVVPTSGQDTTSFSSLDKRVEYFSEGKVEDLAQYISIVYNFLISIVGLVASVAMIVGGFQYLTAGGDASKIGAAKTRMTNAFMGMILALGAFTILRTINPDLLTMKSLNTTTVSTELSFFPWCEDLIKVGKTITPLKGTGCGGLGEFDAAAGKKDLCAYIGNCRIGTGTIKTVFGNTGTRVSTCMQAPGLDIKKVQEKLAADPNTQFAHCVTCGFITETRSKEMGFQKLEDACDAWEGQVNRFREADSDNQFLWSYCGKAESYKSCVQADINCMDANDNDDDALSPCDENSHVCGCEGYDDQPTPYFSQQNQGGFEVINDGLTRDTLDALQDHLANVCLANPCKDFVDNRVTAPEQVLDFDLGSMGKLRMRVGPRSFADGCKGDRGLVSSAIRYVRKGDLSFPDCRKAPPP